MQYFQVYALDNPALRWYNIPVGSEGRTYDGDAMPDKAAD